MLVSYVFVYTRVPSLETFHYTYENIPKFKKIQNGIFSGPNHFGQRNITCGIKSKNLGGEMAYPEDPGLVPRTYMVIHNPL